MGPCTRAVAAGGEVHAHVMGAQGVGGFDLVAFPNNCCQCHFLMCFHRGVRLDVGRHIPESGVGVVDSRLEMLTSVGKLGEQCCHIRLVELSENARRNLLPAGYQGRVFNMKGGRKTKALLFD